jgi:hypothetical protein
MCTVTGKVTNALGGALGNVVVTFELYDGNGAKLFGSDQPRDDTTEVIFHPAPVSVSTIADGTFSVVLVGNDQITPTGTLYGVRYRYGQWRSDTVFYSIVGSTFDINSAAPSGATALASSWEIITVTSTASGNFSVAHTLGVTPTYATLSPTSSPGIWFQANGDGSIKMDANYIYLTATDAGLTAQVRVTQ